MSEFAQIASLAAAGQGGAGGAVAPGAAQIAFQRAGSAPDALRLQNPFASAGNDDVVQHPAVQIQENLQSRRFQAQVRTSRQASTVRPLLVPNSCPLLLVLSPRSRTPSASTARPPRCA